MMQGGCRCVTLLGASRAGSPEGKSIYRTEGDNDLQEVVNANNTISNGLQSGIPMDRMMEQWDYLQTQCACFINSDLPGLPSQLHLSPGKPVK